MGDFTMPSLGADMEAGTLVEWKIHPGDVVKRGDIVAEVETQKGLIDVEVFEDGVVDALLVDAGTSVPVGTVLAHIRGEGESTREARAAPAPAVSPSPAEKPSKQGPSKQSPPEVEPPRPRTPTASPHRLRASPSAKVRASELGVRLDEVLGTGPAGAITRSDVERTALERAPTAPELAPAAPERAPTTSPGAGQRAGMREAIAAAMSRSKREIPHYYLSTRIDLSAALEWLREQNASKAPSERLLPLALLLKAVALAVRKVPEVNGYFERGGFRQGAGVHLGVAISLREGGLITPALHDVDAKPLAVVGRELSDLVERARRGQLKSSELSDGTLTVSALGERGVEEVFGVIFPPQVALVGFGKIVEAPWVIEGRCVPRQTVVATLAADHRVSDGHRGGLFLAEVSRLLQRVEEL